MMHFSCDLCGKSIMPGDDQRYVVRIEASAAPDAAQITDADLDEDHLVEVSQLLRATWKTISTGTAAAPARKNFRFDLCPECHSRFVQVIRSAREHGLKLFFSKN